MDGGGGRVSEGDHGLPAEPDRFRGVLQARCELRTDESAGRREEGVRHRGQDVSEHRRSQPRATGARATEQTQLRKTKTEEEGAPSVGQVVKDPPSPARTEYRRRSVR